MKISLLWCSLDLQSVRIYWLHVDAKVVENLSILNCFNQNHAQIEVNIQELSHNLVAFPCVGQVMIGSMRRINSLKHILIYEELNLTAPIAIVDQAAVKRVQNVCSTEFNTDGAD